MLDDVAGGVVDEKFGNADLLPLIHELIVTTANPGTIAAATNINVLVLKQ